ncbi:DNA mismatch repair protein MutL [Orenia metallireducens]|uniref:DNA mismatch repair protein MutL n=1 Tax=Orenia metallireducens TaxID=1413210 RepID=A0A1C0A7L5_9FIRM|nr:DNA mismatch repair endonuclease MutL [Orenia metallireducens]OCL26236.1 DNA mismatch repair protein MutL [Orenia metallireducens]
MGKIRVLAEDVANKIAAGEVIERPASVVKELVENSIDAGASKIEIKVKNGGKDWIQVIDNGEGMSPDDAKLSFERHATSKVERANDLFALRTLGFRGEALPSIASISRVNLTTRTEESLSGIKLRLVGGEIEKEESCGAPIGTNIIIKDLFFNTPVRYKYLKQISTEIGHISDIVNRLALSYPEIAFYLEHNGRKILETTGNGNLLDVIFNIYGRQVAKEMVKVDYSDNYMEIKGYVSKPTVTRSSRKHQSYFVNGRYVKSNLMGKAVQEAYHTLLTVHRQPIVVLNLKLNPILVDVNVHPTKLEAKFSRSEMVYGLVQEGVTKAIKSSDLVPKLKLDKKQQQSRDNYTQNELVLAVDKKYRSKKKDKSSQLESKVENKNFNYRANHPQKAKKSKELRAKKIEKLFKVDEDKLATAKIESIKENKVENNIKETAQDYKPEDNNAKKDKEIEDKRVELNLVPIGQIHQTYIIAQGLDGMHIIDQHAAHERVRYEELMAEFKSGEIKTQELLIPLNLDLTYQEVEILNQDKDKIEKLGFILESFGGNSYIVRGVPTGLYNLNDEELIRDCIDKLLEEGELGEAYELVEDILIMISCKTAIKAGDKLSIREMNKLIDEMERYGVTNCPHGRPVMMQLSKKELEKEFKRT